MAWRFGDGLASTVRRSLERSDILVELDGPVRPGVAPVAPPGAFAALGASRAIQLVARQIRQVARSGFTVLIQGETGAGKELVARAIHEQSDRAAGPLVVVDCGAIPESLIESELFGYEKGAFSGAERRKDGLFVVANGGSIFLDEIGNLSLATQAKLLRVMQERQLQPLGAVSPRKLDIRFVAATNLALETAVAEGRFRGDLFYRLAEFTIDVPSLRERGDDVLVLARRFLEQANLELGRAVGGFDDEAAHALHAHRWPGNVRELRNVVRRAVLTSDHDAAIGGATMQALLRGEVQSGPEPPPARGRTLREIAGAAVSAAERAAIVGALRATHGNKSRAARLLHVDFKTLHAKMRRYAVPSFDAADE